MLEKLKEIDLMNITEKEVVMVCEDLLKENKEIIKEYIIFVIDKYVVLGGEGKNHKNINLFFNNGGFLTYINDILEKLP